MSARSRTVPVSALRLGRRPFRVGFSHVRTAPRHRIDKPCLDKQGDRPAHGRAGPTKSHARVHLKPRRLDRLHINHLVEMFDAVKDDNEVFRSQNAERRAQMERCKWQGKGRPPASELERLDAERSKLDAMKPFRRPTEAATRQRIRATLRNALNSAIQHQLITFNPATYVELDSGKRPKPQVWTADRVRRWEETGEKPGSVMVWTPAQFGAFLDEAEGDRLYALFHLIGFRGLRRGEGVGQDWTDVDLDEGLITPSRELLNNGGEVYESEPKTDGSAATIGLDSETVRVLRAHRTQQAADRLEWGEAWQDTGKVCTKENGAWLRPDEASRTFCRIYQRAGLPPISLRDLRHVAAVPRARKRTDGGQSGSPRTHTDPVRDTRNPERVPVDDGAPLLTCYFADLGGGCGI